MLEDIGSLYKTLGETIKQLDIKTTDLETNWKKREQEIMDKVKQESDALKREKEEFQKQVMAFENLKKEMERCAKGSSEKIKLNVGGTVFSMYRETLLVPDTFFYAMLGDSKWQPDKDGEYFIDRSPTYFSYILNYLRHNTWDLIGFTGHDVILLQKELDYYLLPPSMWPWNVFLWSSKSANTYQLMDNQTVIKQTQSVHNIAMSEKVFNKQEVNMIEIEIFIQCCGGVGLAPHGCDVSKSYGQIAFLSYGSDGIVKSKEREVKAAVWVKKEVFEIGIKICSNVISFFYKGEQQATMVVDLPVKYVLVVDMDELGSTATLKIPTHIK